MARAKNPYAGTYAPARVRGNSGDLKRGLKSIKVPTPNKHLSENKYKVNLKKTSEEEGS